MSKSLISCQQLYALAEYQIFANNSAKDKEHYLYFDELSDNILANVSEDNRKYVQKQLDVLYDNFIDYLEYWNEKYYRNGFCDGVELISRSLEK